MVSIESTQNQPSDNKMFYKKNKQEITKSIKNYCTPKNIIMDSLVAMGAIGAADLVLYKGKHLNKIAGNKFQELKEVEKKYAEVNTTLAKKESLLDRYKTMLEEQTEKIEALNKKLRTQKSKVERLKNTIEQNEFEIKRLNSELENK